MANHNIPPEAAKATKPAANGNQPASPPPPSTGKPAPGQTASKPATPKQPPDAGLTPSELTAKDKNAGQPQQTKTKEENPIDLLRKLVERANGGEQWAILRLRKFLDANPSFWREAGDLAAVAERSWLELVVGTDLLAVESAKRKLAEMKAELKGSHPTRTESLLVDVIAVAWLTSQHAELQASTPITGSLDQATWKLRRAESSQKRLLTATKTLATLRALTSRGLAPLNPLKLFVGDGTA